MVAATHSLAWRTGTGHEPRFACSLLGAPLQVVVRGGLPGPGELRSAPRTPGPRRRRGRRRLPSCGIASTSCRASMTTRERGSSASPRRHDRHQPPGPLSRPIAVAHGQVAGCSTRPPSSRRQVSPVSHSLLKIVGSLTVNGECAAWRSAERPVMLVCPVLLEEAVQGGRARAGSLPPVKRSSSVTSATQGTGWRGRRGVSGARPRPVDESVRGAATQLVA